MTRAAEIELYLALRKLAAYPSTWKEAAFEKLEIDYFLRLGATLRPVKVLITEIMSGLPSFAKFNPNHDPHNGEFTSGPSGSASDSDTSGIDDPPIQPVYPIETLLTAFSGGTVLSAVRSLLGLVARSVAGSAIEDAAQLIEDYLGGPPDQAFQNDAGDMILMRDNKKIRFDINDFSPHEAPHFHIEEQTPDGEWVDAGNQHWYSFDGE